MNNHIIISFTLIFKYHDMPVFVNRYLKMVVYLIKATLFYIVIMLLSSYCLYALLWYNYGTTTKYHDRTWYGPQVWNFTMMFCCWNLFVLSWYHHYIHMHVDIIVILATIYWNLTNHSTLHIYHRRLAYTSQSAYSTSFPTRTLSICDVNISKTARERQ